MGPLELVGVMGNLEMDGEGACLEMDGDEGRCRDIDSDGVCPETDDAGVCLDMDMAVACLEIEGEARPDMEDVGMCLPNAGDAERPNAGEAALREIVVLRDGGCVIVPLL